MKNYTMSTPKGTHDILYADCKVRRNIEENFMSLFESRGYSEIRTPTMEFYDVFMKSGNPVTQEEMFKLVGPDGRLLILRPDMTTPIARVAATRLPESGTPYRLCYVQDVYIAGDVAGRDSQTTQAGIELIGAAGVKADIEVIAVAIEALGRVSGRYRLEIGHAGFFRSLVSTFTQDEEKIEEIRNLIECKNFAAINDVLEEYKDYPAYKALCRLPQLFGGEEVLDEAIELAEGCAGVEEIEYLRTILHELTSAGFGDSIMIDLGLVHHMDYYTGVVFQGYIEGVGSRIVGGGRYDSLVGMYGRSVPATGFAIDVDRVCEVAEYEQEIKKHYVLHVEHGCLRKAMDFCDNHKNCQCELSPYEDIEDSRNLAKQRAETSISGCTLVRIYAGGAKNVNLED